MNDQDSDRQNGQSSEGRFELTAAEEKAMKELRRDRAPSESLEQRVVSVLHERGLLVKQRRRVIELTAWRSLAAAAVCLVLLAAGFILGHWSGSHESRESDPLRQTSDVFSAAESLQRTGSAYLQALQHFANTSGDSKNDEAIQGQEVAVTTLCTAADQITRLLPKDVLTGELLAALDSDVAERNGRWNGKIVIERGRVIEF